MGPKAHPPIIFKLFFCILFSLLFLSLQQCFTHGVFRNENLEVKKKSLLGVLPEL